MCCKDNPIQWEGGNHSPIPLEYTYITTINVVTLLGEKMMSWGNVTADKFIHELSEFLSNNAYQDEGINVENVSFCFSLLGGGGGGLQFANVCNNDTFNWTIS